MEDPLHRDIGRLMRPDVIQVWPEVTGVLIDGAGGRDQEEGEEGDQEDCHPYSWHNSHHQHDVYLYISWSPSECFLSML